MKNSFKYITIALSILALGAVSCSQKEDTYKPATPEDGPQYYFPTGSATSYVIASDVTQFEIPINRAISGSATTAVVAVTDTSKTVFSDGAKDVEVAFAADAKSSSVVLPIDYSKFEFGDTFGISLKIKADTTVYAPSSLNIVITLPEPWTSLGTNGKYIDKYWGWTSELTVEILQNDLDPTQFKILNPYKGAPQCTTNGYITLGGEPDSELIVKLLKKGETFAGVEITQDDLVYFPYILVGYKYDDGSNSGPMEIDHPAEFKSLGTEDKWLFNKVLSYQEDGLPAQIQLAPYYYIAGLGGFNRTQADDMITITFPGVVVADHSVEIAFQGVLTDTEGVNNALVDVAYTGKDTDEVSLFVIPASEEANALAILEAGLVEVNTINAAGTHKVPISEDYTPGKFVVVAVPLDSEGAPDAKKVVSASFVYGNLSPLQMEYTGDDLIDGISKEDLLATTWTAYAVDDEKSPVEREAYAKVTFEEAEDIAADSDRILAHGFSYGGADYYKFSETLYMEYYEGLVYTLGSSTSLGTVSGYDVYPTYVTADGEVFSREDDYLMAAAYVAEGLLAFVSADENNNFTQICYGAWSGDDYAGWFTCMNYVLLADPSIYPDPAVAIAAFKKAKLGKAQPKKEIASVSRKNSFTIDRSIVK